MSQGSGAHLAISRLGVCPVMALKSHIQLWKEGRMIVLFPKRLFHNHAPSLLDLLSYWSEISCGSTGEPAGRALSPRAPTEPGTQSLSVVLPGFSAKTSRSPLCRGEGGSVYGLLQPVAQPKHQAVPAMTGTVRDAAPGTELWVQTLAYLHTGYQRIIQR